MSELTVKAYFFGTPSLESPPGRRKLGPGKPLALLAYLLIEGKAQRSELISLLWGDQTEQNARNSFRQTLHRLRVAMGEGFISATGYDVWIERDERLWTDVGAFEKAFKKDDVDGVASVYVGPFLDGIGIEDGNFGHWLIQCRRAFEVRSQSTLRTASTACLRSGETEKALLYAAKLARSAPLDGDAALIFSNALLSAGRSDEARASLEEFSRRFRDEMGEHAGPAVREALARIRTHSETPLHPRSNGKKHSRTVGRETELSKLGAVWNDVREGNGAILVVEGPEGIGKSALVAEFTRRVEPLGPMLLLSGYEQAAATRIPYASIAGAIRGTLVAPGLSGASRHLLAEASRLLPELRDQFELPDPETVEGEGAKLRLFEGVAALLDAVAYEQPVCMVLEDFHHAAAETRDLLQYLTGRLEGAAVLFLVIARSSSESAIMPSRKIERLVLAPLSLDAAAQIVRDASDDEIVSAEDCERLGQMSGGVPFRALELARQVGGGLISAFTPVTLHDALLGRLQGFPPVYQRLFIACALIERPITIRTAAAAAHISESAALDAVIALEAAGLLTQSQTGIKPAHDSAATIAMEGTGPAGRALLAGWAAEALEQVPGTRCSELAYLYNIAGDRARTFRSSISAVYEAGALGSQDRVRFFLDMAQKTASSATDQRDLAAAEGVFADDYRRIGPGESSGAPTSEGAVHSEETADRASPVNRPTAHSFSQGQRLMFLGIAGAALVLGAFAIARPERDFQLTGPLLPDTLVLAERGPTGARRQFYVTGQPSASLVPLSRGSESSRKTWVDSLQLPWVNPRISPSGAFVAMEKLSADGSAVFVSRVEKLDPKKISAYGGDNIITDWSPDGSRVLIMRGRLRPDSSYAADLLAYDLMSDRTVVLDSAEERSVVEALWSPDGTHIALTARSGETHQQEVFILNADGSGLKNVSGHRGEDYHVAWAQDGGRIAFTSDRTGDAEIFSYNLLTHEVRRLTWDNAQDDRATFSPNGDFVAFESTRAGTASVYVTRSYGATPVKVSSTFTGLRIAAWRGQSSRSYLDAVKVSASPRLDLGDSIGVTAIGLDVNAKSIPINTVTWKSLDPEILHFKQGSPGAETGQQSISLTGFVTGVGRGVGRLVGSAGGWRADTVFLQVGNDATILLSDSFEEGITDRTWQRHGFPLPTTAVAAGFGRSNGVSLNADRHWESGILSRAPMPLRSGLTADIWVSAPFSPITVPMSFNFALVAPEPQGSVDPAAPRFLTLASIQWIGRAARVSYGAEQEVWTEPVTTLEPGTSHSLRISLDEVGRAVFYVDGTLRWRSNVRLQTSLAKTHLWIGGEGTGNKVVFDSVLVTTSPVGVRR